MFKFKNGLSVLGLCVVLMSPTCLSATNVEQPKVVENVSVTDSEGYTEKAEITSFSINKVEGTLICGETYQLSVNIAHENIETDIVWKSLNTNAIVSQTGKLTILNKGDIKVTATMLNDGKELVAKFTGKSMYGTNWFKLCKGVINIKNSTKGKIMVTFDRDIDAHSVTKNISITKDEAGNDIVGGLTIYVDGSSLIITNEKGWATVKENELYLCINKDLKDSKGVALNTRLKYKITKD